MYIILDLLYSSDCYALGCYILRFFAKFSKTKIGLKILLKPEIPPDCYTFFGIFCNSPGVTTYGFIWFSVPELE